MRARYIEWCNENEGRSFPISEEASRISLQGQSLPDDILVDMCVMVPVEYLDAYVSMVRVTPALYSVAVASASNLLLTGTYAVSSYTPYSAVPLEPLISDVSGWVAFGNHRSQPAEQYNFKVPEDSQLEPRVVRIVPALPIRRMLRTGGAATQYVEGLVELLGGNALRTYQDPDNLDTIIIELNTNACEKFLGPCDIYPDSEGKLTPIKEINGVQANPSGILTLRFQG